MPINITVEDGTNVAGANSWVDIADAREIALSRGVILSTDDDIVASQLIRAADYINAKRSQFKGTKTYPTGLMQWPREGVYIDRLLTLPNNIPVELRMAQVSLVTAIEKGVDIDGPSIGGVLPVIREKVDVIETEYATPAMMGAMSGTDWNNSAMPAFEAWIAPLLNDFAGFRVYRV